MIDLVMIVKNESEGIASTLRSFLPFVNRWMIADTGSTDDTRDIILSTAEDVGQPGTLLEIDFTNYARTRNELLDAHSRTDGRSEFTLMADADDLLVGGKFLLQEFPDLARGPGARFDGFYLNRRLGDLDWDVPLLFRTSAKLRYEGKIHETVTLNAPCLPGEFVSLVKQSGEHSKRKSRERWEHDLPMLLEDRKQGDTRSAFYYAQTLECLGRLADAETAYDHRCSMDGWSDETCVARLRQARLRAKLGYHFDSIEASLHASLAFDPNRAETNLELANLHYRRGNTATAMKFAYRAATIRTRSVLFREKSTEETAKALHTLCSKEEGMLPAFKTQTSSGDAS